MKICEICKKTIFEDEVFGVDGHESVCFECAETEALKAKKENRKSRSNMVNLRKPGASASGVTACSRKVNFRRNATS